MNDEVYTTEAINNFLYESNIRGFISLLFGFLSIAAILRYTTKSMEEYKFHLLNMSISILACDLSLTVLCRSFPTMPMSGGCMLGELSWIMMKVASLDSTFYVVAGLEIYMLLSSMATVCNATIHRYVFVSDLVNQSSNPKHKFHVYFLMFFIQVIWPLLAVIACLRIDLHPQPALEINRELYLEIMQRTADKPCIMLWVDRRAIYENYMPVTLAILNGCFCGIGSAIILLMCWNKIINAKFGNLSQRTLNMQRKLAITLFFQTLIPNIAYVGGASTLAIGMLSGIKSTEYFANHIFLYVSAHSILNCGIMFTTIPAFNKGLFNDLKYVISCGNYYNTTSSISSISKIHTTTHAAGYNKFRVFRRVS